MPILNRRNMLALSMTPLAAGLIGTSKNSLAVSQVSSREVIRDRYFSNVILTTHEGRRVRLYEDLVKDRTVTINFMFATCTELCPRTTANLVRVQRLLGNGLGRDIFMYSITLKPREDSPKVLAEYARHHGVLPGWQFLTGNPDDIEWLRRRLGFTDPDPVRDRDLTNHIGNVRYGNEPRQLWATCPSLADPSWIAQEIGWVMR